MRVDIRQVAGVSTATVSRVLSGRGPASPDATLAVRSAAQRLNYLPSASASTLRTDRSMTIGMLVQSLANPEFLPFLQAVEHTAQPFGYAVIVAGRPSDHGHVRVLRDAGLPVTDPEQSATQAGSSMRTRSAPAIESACRYLAALGHRKVAYLMRRAASQRASDHRWDLIETTCGPLGIRPERVTIPSTDGRPATVLEALFGSDDPPTTLWSASHRLAPEILEGLANVGVDLPADCSFLTFGDSPSAVAYRPSISVITIDTGAAARAMTNAMLHRPGSIETVPPFDVEPDAYIARLSVGPAPVRSS
jgi:LacI family transcriptional regulator